MFLEKVIYELMRIKNIDLNNFLDKKRMINYFLYSNKVIKKSRLQIPYIRLRNLKNVREVAEIFDVPIWFLIRMLEMEEIED